MKSRSKNFSLGILTFSAMLVAGSAQACLFGSAATGSSNCQAGKSEAQSCPVQGQSAGTSGECLVSRGDLAQAANGMGSMAAGGISIASEVLKALAGQASRMSSLN